MFTHHPLFHLGPENNVTVSCQFPIVPSTVLHLRSYLVSFFCIDFPPSHPRYSPNYCANWIINMSWLIHFLKHFINRIQVITDGTWAKYANTSKIITCHEWTTIYISKWTNFTIDPVTIIFGLWSSSRVLITIENWVCYAKGPERCCLSRRFRVCQSLKSARNVCWGTMPKKGIAIRMTRVVWQLMQSHECAFSMEGLPSAIRVLCNLQCASLEQWSLHDPGTKERGGSMLVALWH